MGYYLKEEFPLKTLKKTLALMLVVAMMFSFGVIGASAAFDDAKDVNADYAEAVEVMSDLGIIKGLTDTTFGHDSTLTRAQACMFIARITLGTDTAAKLTASSKSFTDVAADYWGYDVIEYCYNAGLIAGYGDGKFGPDDALSSYAFAKMLMAALGVDVSACTGANWQIETAKLFIKTGFSSIVLTAGDFTREVAAQMVYDALFYSSNATEGYGVYKNGTLVAYYESAGEAATQAALLDALDSVTSNVYTNDTSAVTIKSGATLAKTVFGVTRTSGYDATYGRPGNVYVTAKKAQATAYGWAASSYSTQAKFVAEDAVATYSTAIKPAAVALALTNDGYKTTGAVNWVINGTATSYDAAAVAAWAAKTTYEGGNGCLVEFYATNGVIDRVVIVNTYAAEVNSYTKDTASTTTVDERSLTVTVDGGHVYKISSSVTGFDAAYEAATTALAANTSAYLLVVPKNDNTAADTTGNGVIYVAVPESLTVTPTAYVTGVSFTAGGTTYKYSKNCVGAVTFTAQTVLLDEYGYVIKASVVTPATNYAIVVGYQNTTSWGVVTHQARLVLADGSTVDVTAKADANSLVGDIVTYTVSSEVYALTSAAVHINTEAAFAVTKGVAAFKFNNTDYTANAKTLFIVRSGLGTTASPFTYAVYTGIANMPSMKAADATGAIVADSSSVAKVVYVENAAATTAGNAVVFIPHDASASSEYINGAWQTFYTSAAIVDGEFTTLKLDQDYAQGVWLVKGTDSNGYVTLANASAAPIGTGFDNNATATAITVSSSLMTLGDGAATYSIASDCAVYTYDAATNTFEVGSLASVSATSVGMYTLASNLSSSGAAIVNAIYVVA